ncbi:hypothetical protein [Nocardia abscessus]|uniref:hypothetical protein n=1 Tax=Nocardia abscessus TaxID=120957 RepID=UPI0024573EF7|nr:hypothetical protein [Nocardia abscessus]
MTDAAAHGVSAPSPAAGRDRFRATDRRGPPPPRGAAGGGGELVVVSVVWVCWAA